MKLAALAFITLVSGLTTTATLADENLAKQSQNPVGNLISVPIEFWH